VIINCKSAARHSYLNSTHLRKLTSAAFGLALLTFAPAFANAQEDTGNQLIPGPASGASVIRPITGTSLPASVDFTRSALVLLLRRADVVKSLRLNATQIEILDPIIRTYEPGMNKAAARPYQSLSKDALGQMSPEQISGLQKRAAQAQADYLAGVEKKILTTLNPRQAARMGQLDLQFRTALAMTDPLVAARFKATPAQVAAIKVELAACQDETADLLQREVTTWQLQKQKEAMLSPRHRKPTSAQTQAADEMQKLLRSLKPEIAGIRNSHGRKALALLTEEQQQEWRTALGSEFDFDSEQ